jgi:hypothetical protein
MSKAKDWLLARKSYYRWYLYKTPERFWMFVAWKLPRTLAMWAAVRVIAHATTGPYGDTVVPDLSAMDALKRWDDSGKEVAA